jgi:hypothetical protein
MRHVPIVFVYFPQKNRKDEDVALSHIYLYSRTFNEKTPLPSRMQIFAKLLLKGGGEL